MKGAVELDLLAANNACGQCLLQLVSRAHAVVAELLRLAERVPADLAAPPAAVAELLPDFGYFKQPLLFEERLDKNASLQALDEDLRDNYSDILRRFFIVFESIYTYVSDLNRYLEELDDGVYIQQNLESVLLNSDGKQLLAEALYMYGVMLLLVDAKIDGVVRERLLVAYYRYNGQRTALQSDIDDICALLRSTGYSALSAKRPPSYPESYFRRVTLNENFIGLVVGRLRSDDIYNQILAFPHPDHRSAALAPQAAMLYVCLYFLPDVLTKQTATMREVVDKYFPDNWIISVYMGYTVNLVEAWEPYRAAKHALTNSLDEVNVKNLAQTHGKELTRLSGGVQQFLLEGALTADYVLENTNRLLNSIRRCNVTLRWLLLHSAPLKPEWKAVKRCASLRDLVLIESKFNRFALFELLLRTSQFELKFKERVKIMLVEKTRTCESMRKDCADKFAQLVDVYSGAKPLTNVAKNEKLQKWFSKLQEQMEKLELEKDSDATGRKLVQICARLHEAKDMQSLEAHKIVREFVSEVQTEMQQLLRWLNLREHTLAQIQIIADLTYAWEIVDDYTGLMQEGIKREPDLAIKLRAAFLKLSSALDLPLLRIQQAGSADLLSVSQFYSRELVLYVRRVLQVIPETVFSLLSQIVHLQTAKIRELPTRLDKEKLREYAALDARYENARLTYAISVLTEGILMMKTTLVGIIKVDPKQVLEDGIRRELVRQVATALNHTLTFNAKAKQSELAAKLQSVHSQLDGFKRSFAYISDYIGLSGLRIWQEELGRIFGYNVEMESGRYMRHRISDDESVFQSRVVPIPRFAPVDGNAINFVGRLLHEFIRHTDPKTSVFVEGVSTWYDAKSHTERLNSQAFQLLLEAIGGAGVAGFDKLCCFSLVSLLQKLVATFKEQLVDGDGGALLQGSAGALAAISGKLAEQPGKLYESVLQKLAKLFGAYVDLIAKIGQLQLLRVQLMRHLASAAKFDAQTLEADLQNLNRCVLADIAAHDADKSKPFPKEDNPLMYELSQYLEASAITEPLIKVYISAPRLPNAAPFLFLLLLWLAPKLTIARHVGLVAKKQQEALDAESFVTGFATVCHQLPIEQRQDVAELTGQCITSFVHAAARGATAKQSDLPPDVGVLVELLVRLTRFGDFDFSKFEPNVSSVLLAQHSLLTSS